MKAITPKSTSLLSNIRSIYQHPYHYTYVLHKTDNFVYLYDELSVEVVGRTKVAFS